MKNKLNFKHKSIIDHYIGSNCLSQIDSYLYVYNKVTYSNNGMHVRASEIFNRPEVKSYLEHQQQKLSKKYDLTKERVIRELCELLDDCKDEKNGMKDRTNWGKALSIINKMFGYDTPTEVNVNIKTFKADFGNKELIDGQ